jgi:hypothetical protein
VHHLGAVVRFVVHGEPGRLTAHVIRCRGRPVRFVVCDARERAGLDGTLSGPGRKRRRSALPARGRSCGSPRRRAMSKGPEAIG